MSAQQPGWCGSVPGGEFMVEGAPTPTSNRPSWRLPQPMRLLAAVQIPGCRGAPIPADCLGRYPPCRLAGWSRKRIRSGSGTLPLRSRTCARRNKHKCATSYAMEEIGSHHPAEEEEQVWTPRYLCPNLSPASREEIASGSYFTKAR